MEKARFGVVGTGFWGRNHARVLSELKNAELVAVCDIDVSRAKSIGDKYGVKWYIEEEELLRRSDIDAVCICTPTITHGKIALKAIEYGKDILVEKPMASTLNEAKRILECAAKKSVYTMTGFIERFNPGVQKAKELIISGTLGDVVLILAKRVGSWPQRIGDVGVVKDLAIHDIDVVRFLLGEEPISVYARAGKLAHMFEDYAQIMMGFKGIRTAFVEANWLTPHKIRTLNITGSKAMVTVDYITQEIKIEDAEKMIQPTYQWKEPLMLELEHFAECVLEDRKPDVTGLDGLRALEIAEVALRSIETGNVLTLRD